MVGGTDVHSLEDGDYEDIQLRVPPAYDDTRQVRPLDVDRPENAHQAIMLWHDRQP